jgi:hypothetical protein
MPGRNTQAFLIGSGQGPEPYVCSECGYSSANRKHFKKGEGGEGHTCSTGHYDKDGELKRARNPYARR